MSEQHVGCAGWSIRAEQKSFFREGDSHLSRYATVFNAVEINSSFYRPHQRKTYERWRDSVPARFKFSVKLLKTLTHTQRLTETEGLPEFLNQVAGLEGKLGPILVQLPPSLIYDTKIVEMFFTKFRRLYNGLLACEPRHPSWFTESANDLLVAFKVARVAADPPVGDPRASEPGGWNGLTYFRLHGSPKIYYSPYDREFLKAQAEKMKNSGANSWCIFDNTALGAAAPNALELQRELKL